MATKPDHSQLNTEFGVELELERQQLLRRRFLWYTGTVATISGLAFFGGLLFGSPDKDEKLLHLIGLFFSGAATTLFVGSFVYVYLNHLTRWPLIKICLWLIVVSGVLNLLAGPLAMGQMENIVRKSNAKAAARSTEAARAGDKRADKVATAAKDDKVVEPKSENVGQTPGLTPPANSIDTQPAITSSNGETGDQTPDQASDQTPAQTPEVDATVPQPPVTVEENEEWAKQNEISQKEILTMFAAVGVGIGGAFSIFGRHFLACLFLPLTPRECIQPLVPLLILNAALIVIYVIRALIGGASWYIVLAGFLVIAFSPAIGIPGYLVICWRDSSFRQTVRNRLVGQKYNEMNRELIDARRIHESLFPKPICDGEISLTYAYEPMRQIGGDYLFCKHTLGPAGNQRLNIIMLDVTGHGIPAALTVNRLHGELERIFAEQPNTDPGQVLRLLNRYVNLTLAGHWVYVTGLCVRVDSAAQSLEFASGGHPPAFLYGATGAVDELHSTAMILGAIPDSEFDSAMETRRFTPGDRLIAYTDGAFECRDHQGNQLRIAGIRSLISRGPGTISDWPAAIIKCVEQFRHGPPPDDTLVVELQFSANQPSGPRSEPKTEFFKAARSGIYRAIKN